MALCIRGPRKRRCPRALQVLGVELLEEWVARTVPPQERHAWLAANDLTITLFVAPQARLLRLAHHPAPAGLALCHACIPVPCMRPGAMHAATFSYSWFLLGGAECGRCGGGDGRRW